MLPEESPYQKIDDMIWPKANQGDLEWILRHGHEEDIIKKRWLLASIISAYGEMVNMTQKQRNRICKDLKQDKEGYKK